MMRQFNHMLQSGCLICLSALLLFSIDSRVAAQPKTGTMKQPKTEAGRVKLNRPIGLNRPVGKSMRVRYSSEMEWILKTWEQQGNTMKRLEGKLERYTYDFTFNVEKRASGEFYYESYDKARLDIQPVKIKKGSVNEHGPRGRKFTIQPDEPKIWISDGINVSMINVVRKEYQRLVIPPEGRGKNIVDGPLPFLFGISAEKAKARYRMELYRDTQKGGMHNLKKGIVHLRVYPLWKQDAANWVQAEVLLDAKTFLPTAIKLIHPGGTTEMVYTFHAVKRNKTRGVFAGWNNPFKPNLRGYKEMKRGGTTPPKGTAKKTTPGRAILR